MWHRVAFGLGLVLLPLACGSEDPEEKDERVWRCFEGSMQCWCVNVSPGDQAGSSDPEVDRCSYTNCIAYREGSTDQCECQPAPFMPPDFYEDVRMVTACPFD